MRIAAKSSFVVLSDVALSLGSLTATAGWGRKAACPCSII